MMTIEYAYSRFCTKRFPLPTEMQVSALEQRIKIDFPDDYRQFLLEFNGGYFNEPEIEPGSDGCPQATLEMLFGMGAPHRVAELGRLSHLSLFDDNDPPIILPIGSTGMGGLIILITEPENCGNVFLKQEFGDFYYLADGIEEFCELLREPTWA